jgi:DNA-binding CsgD family transcriptional regulator
LAARAARDGVVLAAPGEEADLVARVAPMPPGEVSRKIHGRPSAGGFESPASLGKRELEILEYLADGWSNAEIASALGIGIRTVRFHLGNLYASLGVGRRGEAVREAVLLGLIRFET